MNSVPTCLSMFPVTRHHPYESDSTCVNASNSHSSKTLYWSFKDNNGSAGHVFLPSHTVTEINVCESAANGDWTKAPVETSQMGN